MSQGSEPSFEDMLSALKRMRAAARVSRTAPSLEERTRDLDKLERVILAKKDAIAKAVSADFGHRSSHETLLAEVFLVLSVLRHCREHLTDWMAPEDRNVGLVFFPARAELRMQPLGVVGVIAPWNYPFQLAMAPLVTAIAAGNRVLLKPSEFTPETSKVTTALLSEVFPHEQVRVFDGGARVAQDFGRLPLDHILFTGSTAVGKLVMKAAAENLVPVTLELGGKSPVIVGPGFSLETAAERILTGKLLNAGQTCIAPDYVLLPKGSADEFAEECKKAMAKLYPTLANNPDYTSIIHQKHYDRLRMHLSDAETKGAKVIDLNPNAEELDAAKRKMSPCLVLHAKEEMSVMQEEVFGPILPLRTYETLEEALDYINDRPRPLALYIFDNDEMRVERILQETTAGGVTVNETMLHIAQDDLPFGGVGASGMGHYHGKEGFNTFSKQKPVVYQSRINATGLMRPPYTNKTDFILNRLIG
jgi:coniferyl-aldehyde dehydrogenase